GGIWAVDWHSLDGTSWLYFTAAGKSPFDLAEGIPAIVQSFPDRENERHFIVSVIHPGEVLIKPLNPFHNVLIIRISQLDGRIISERKVPANSGEITLLLSPGHPGYKVVIVQIISPDIVECYPVFLYN
ncbi:MAG: hypothetical protein NTV01_10385, partial [Bacteroidia bacterium]|nr:hypothetical protein [Bacteroidia bacterium]